MNKTRQEYIGGNQYSLFERQSDGYDDTVCSIEIGRNTACIIYMNRDITKQELKMLFDVLGYNKNEN